MSREMKDSGVEWIGEIPADWDICKIDSLYFPRSTKVSDKDYPPLSVTMKGIVPQLATTAKTDDHDNRKLVKKGDFAINSRSDRRGSCGISEYDGSVSLINTVLQPRHGMNNEYYNWLFHSDMFSSEFYRLGHGIVDDLRTTSWQEMKKMVIPAPSPTEQQQIVHFLDRKCTAIDTAIEKTKKSIEKLEEYKKAVITKAVTKHEGWTECKLRFVANIVRGGSPRPIDAYITDGEGLNWVKIGDATGNGKYINNTKQKITKDGLNKTRLVPAGTLLLTNSMSFGHPYVLNIEGCIHDGWLAFFDFEKVTQDYLYYFLESDVAMEQFSRSVEGSVVNNLNIDKVKSSYIAFPSITEQNLIVERLDRLCIAINAVIEKKKKAIEKWEEYKKSLIYYAVTGKIDCRNEVIE